MEAPLLARVAVSGVTYWVDKPYTYAVPEALSSRLRPGVRVVVPFGGSRPREGIVLALGGETEHSLKKLYDVLDEEPLLSPLQLKLALWMRERFLCTVMDAVRAMLPSGLWYDLLPVYCLGEGVLPENGGSRSEKLVLGIVADRGGRCELADIEAAFPGKNPGTVFSSLVKKGLLVPDAEALRRGSEKTILKATLAVSPAEAMLRAEQNTRAVRQSAILQVLAQLGKASVADLCYFTGSGRDAVRALEKKGLVTLRYETVYRRPDYDRAAGDDPLPQLNREQERAYEGLSALLREDKPNAALLYGVTGSGKTTVYIRLIYDALRAGKSAILLVPEISLTPQMLQPFASHFGDRIAVLHSALSMGERSDEWRRIRAGDARLVIGTRSAVFAPVSHLGIIILDEEQEDTYKSETTPRYHARDVAKFLCAKEKALLVLGSATPDIGSMYYARSERYHLFTLPERYNAMQLPRVRIADMRQELRSGNGTSLSGVLREEIAENLSRGEQTILFLNRRGSSKLVLCGECGHTYKCPNCSANLTYHSVGDRLMCHYCGYTRRTDPVCPACGGHLKYLGTGTQKVVEELAEVFPDVPVLRMDTDTVAPVGSHRALFERFRVQKIPIMVGTQMVTKGLNFENVTLVGVLSADQSLYTSEYRAGERTFSLITQVIGRSGRFEKPGRAVVQTFTPDNQIITQAASQNYDGFYESELALRSLTGSPPFSELYVLTATGAEESTVLRCCGDIRGSLLEAFRTLPDVRLMGPAPLPVARVNNLWRYRVTVAAPEGADVRWAIRQTLMLCNNSKKYRGVSVYADYNPLD